MATSYATARTDRRPGRMAALAASLWALAVTTLADGLLRTMTGR
jgi:hypothetical protein